MNLQDLLSLHVVDAGSKDGHYRASKLWKPPGGRSVFGGQIVALAIQSSMLFISNINGDWDIHSLHSFFINPGRTEDDLFFRVKLIRKSNSFILLCVKAYHNDDKILVFEGQISYNIRSVDNIEHHTIPKEVEELLLTNPSNLENRYELLERFAIENVSMHPADFKNVDIRFSSKNDIDDIFLHSNYSNQHLRFPSFSYWIKINSDGDGDGDGDGDDKNNNHCSSPSVSLSLSALMTDHLILSTAARQVGRHVWNPKNCLLASLDHCMWFGNNSKIKCNQWNLFYCHSPLMTSCSGSGRGLTIGNLYSPQTRQILLTVVQEGIIRERC